MSKKSKDFDSEKLNPIPLDELDVEQKVQLDWATEVTRKCDRDGMLRLKHLSLDKLGIDGIQNLTQNQIFYLFFQPALDSSDVLTRVIFTEFLDIIINYNPWWLRSVLNKNIALFNIEKVNIPLLYNGLLFSKCYDLFNFWQSKLFPGSVESFLHFISKKNDTYRTAYKFIRTDYRGLARGNEFRLVLEKHTESKVKEIDAYFQNGGFYNTEQIDKIHSFSKTKKIEYGYEMTNLIQEMLKLFDPNGPMKEAAKGIKGPLNQRKYFLYSIMSECFPEQYPDDEGITQYLEKDHSDVNQTMVSQFKRDCVRKFF